MNNLERLEQELSNFTVQNEYYYKMIELIERNWPAGVEPIKGRQIHHICPKFYWKSRNKPVSNEDWNLVSMTYQDHMLCHFYLYKCIEEALIGKSVAPLNFMKRYMHKVIPLTEESIMELVELANTQGGAAIGTHWFYKELENGEIIEIMAKDCPEGYKPGRPSISIKLKGKNTWSKGHKCSEESKKKISEVQKGRKHEYQCYGHEGHKAFYKNRLKENGCCEDAIEWYMEFVYPIKDQQPCDALKDIDAMGMLLEVVEGDYVKLQELISMAYTITVSGWCRKRLWYTNGKEIIRLSRVQVELGQIPEGYYPGRPEPKLINRKNKERGNKNV